MIRVFVSSSAEARLSAARAFVQQYSSGTELTLVGHSREAINDFARESTAAASFGWHRFTLPQLAKRLAAPELASRGAARATALGVEAVAARAIFELKGGLKYFAPVAESPGFARSLARTVLELRMSRVTADALTRDIMKTGAPALADLAELLTRFEQQCEASGIADWPMVLEAAEHAAVQRPGRDPVLLLDLPVRAPAERAFLEAYFRHCPNALITVPAGDDPTLEIVSAWGEIETAPDTVEASSLDRLRTYLFSPEKPPASALDERVTFFSAPGEARECVEIARRILEQAREGVPFDHMAVLTRAPESYAPVLEAALERAGIPAYFVRGARRPDPAGRAFLALLGCAVEKLSARAFAEYLSLAQVPPLDATGAPPAIPPAWIVPEDEAVPETRAAPSPPGESEDQDGPAPGGTLRTPWNWEKLLVEAAVIGGKDRWQRRLDGLRFELGRALREHAGSSRGEAIERQLAHLRYLKNFAMPVITRLDALPQAATWGVWLDRLSELAPMVLRNPDRVLALLAELRPMSEMGPVTLAEVREVLRARLGTLPQEPPESRYGRVFVSPVEQVRGRLFDVVFLPGLAERMFPQKLREDPLLLDDPRIALGPEAALPYLQQRASDERLLLRLAAGAARKRLFLSYPRMELVTSRSRVPSFYGLDVMRAVTGVVPDYKEFEKQATEAAQARLAWPAPARAESAIDEMEYDLATLGPGLASPRFLLQLNPALARALRARYARWNLKTWGTSDGLVLSALSPARAALEKHGLRARPYSASALQKFATCPYQFYLSAIAHLEPRLEAVAISEIDPMTRGHLMHRVLARLMRSLRDLHLLPLTAPNLGVAEKTMDEILDLTAAEYEEQLAPAIPGVWSAGVEAMRADLRGWLRRLPGQPGAWLPAYFEYGFGIADVDPERDPDSISERAQITDGFLLRGVVDLVEGLLDEGSSSAKVLRITDYKTGANRTNERLRFGGGETLQPGLYAMAMESIFPKLKVLESRLSFCTAKGGFKDRVVPVDDHTRETSRQILAAIDDAVGSGFLPPAPRTDACQHCDFRMVCGPYEDQRWKRKDAESDRFKDLKWIRGLE